jgi:hypothetical protein
LLFRPPFGKLPALDNIFQPNAGAFVELHGFAGVVAQNLGTNVSSQPPRRPGVFFNRLADPA